MCIAELKRGWSVPGWRASMLAGCVLLVACSQREPATSGSGENAVDLALQSTPEQGAAETPPAEPEQSPIEQRLAHYRALIQSDLEAGLQRLSLNQAAANVMRRALQRGNEVPISTYRRTLIEELYGNIGFNSVFLEQWSIPGPRAEALLAELHGAPQQALDTAPYYLDYLDRQEARNREADPLPMPAFAIDGSLVEAFSQVALELGNEGGDRAVIEALALRAAGLEGTGDRAAALSSQVQTAIHDLERHLADRVWWEIALTDAYLNYARDMRLGNTNRMSPEELRLAGGHGQVVADRFRESFATIARSSVEDFRRHLEWLYPTHPQYPLLMASLARYRAIVEAGGWETVPARSLSVGSNNSRVTALKERLTIEGFYQGPIDSYYDAGLEQAVRSYQESHQMEVTGIPHRTFWTSLNIPAEERLAQIEINLERWRGSRFEDVPHYVFVNIPDFHAEVWRNGQRAMRFKIVAGNNRRECDPQTRTMAYVNATPQFNAEIEYLVFNPYWYVPDRIRRDELNLELMENPTWLQENEYEVALVEGTYRIRQLPGEENALGMVKFMLPNPYNVYMHDTPLRQYFQYPVRAFSHGCMRVEDPMALAEYLLTQDGQWDPERIQRILDSRVETTLHLRQHVPIFVEYHVTWVDEEGRTNFLADVYRYDRDRIGSSSPRPEACVPTGTAAPPEPGQPVTTVQWQDNGVAILPDGTLINPDGTVLYSEERLQQMEAILQGTASSNDSSSFGEASERPHEVEVPGEAETGSSDILPEPVEIPFGDHGP